MAYTEGQIQGILLTSATPKFQMVSVSNQRGWEPRYTVNIRLPKQMLESAIQSLEHLGVHGQLIRERGRRVDTIIIRRRLDVLRICDLFPPNVPAKGKGWDKFIRLMEMVRNGEHMNNDSRYEFEMIKNEENNTEEET